MRDVSEAAVESLIQSYNLIVIASARRRTIVKLTSSVARRDNTRAVVSSNIVTFRGFLRLFICVLTRTKALRFGDATVRLLISLALLEVSKFQATAQ